ncbi:MAG: DUF4430 domain-containing protein [Dehalococcoidia bacterium]|nr:DUF4430 domain-containing protein [Dehalococcoidia bacterium]
MRLNPRTLLLAAVAGIAVVLFGIAVLGDGAKEDSPSDAGAGLLRGTIAVNFEGAGTPHAPISQPFAVEPGSSAFDALTQSLGESKIAYQDFGGDLGYQILGFDGVTLSGNQFWEFRVNGVSSEIGVSGYKVMEGDALEFRVATF